MVRGKQATSIFEEISANIVSFQKMRFPHSVANSGNVNTTDTFHRKHTQQINPALTDDTLLRR